MAEHALLSASASERWMACPGSIALSQGMPNTTSRYAAEGTAAHHLLSFCLSTATTARSHIGATMIADTDHTFVVDEDMARHVQVVLDYIAEVRGPAGMVQHDLRVCYAPMIGVANDQAWGTLDVMVVAARELIIIDFKYGRGVPVSATENGQLMLYALGALADHGDLLDVDAVKVVICQPRLDPKASEWQITLDDLRYWAEFTASFAAVSVRQAIEEHPTTEPENWAQRYLSPGEKQCRFCPAKGTCPALRTEVALTVSGAVTVPMTAAEFADVQPVTIDIADTSTAFLAAALAKCDLIEDWCKAVRAEAERRMLAGDQLPGWKLVQGKQGNRTWSDARQAEHMLREVFRLPIEDAYDLKLISPTSAEKLAKAKKIGPRQWPKLEALITRAAGSPHVAPDADPRPALTLSSAAAEFQPVVENDIT